MAEKRLIDAERLKERFLVVAQSGGPVVVHVSDICGAIDDEAYETTMDAVVVEDKKLLKAIKMLIKQYDHSKQSEYVHSPVAHALYHTWKKVDGDSDG